MTQRKKQPILLSRYSLSYPNGTVIDTLTLSLELTSLGYDVSIYACIFGSLTAKLLRDTGIKTFDTITSIAVRPYYVYIDPIDNLFADLSLSENLKTQLPEATIYFDSHEEFYNLLQTNLFKKEAV